MRTFLDTWLRRRRAAERRRAAAARIRGIRGAIDVESDTPDATRRAVESLIAAVMQRNGLTADEIISAIFTTTADLTSMFPALAARDAGWKDVPMLCATEIPVPGSLPRCLRLLVHVELPRELTIEHVYLGAAASLRPDLGRSGVMALPETLHPRQHIRRAASASGGETPRR
jgi:chorismate mutase